MDTSRRARTLESWHLRPRITQPVSSGAEIRTFIQRELHDSSIPSEYLCNSPASWGGKLP